MSSNTVPVFKILIAGSHWTQGFQSGFLRTFMPAKGHETSINTLTLNLKIKECLLCFLQQ